MLYLGKCDHDISHVVDLISYNQIIFFSFSNKWLKAMEDEMRSMTHNSVWELVKPSIGVKPISGKWIYKTKKDYKGNIERFKGK